METRRRDAKRAGTVVSDDCPVVSLPEVYYFIRRARRGRASVSSGWLHSCARRGPQRASRAAEVRAATCSTRTRRCRATCNSVAAEPRRAMRRRRPSACARGRRRVRSARRCGPESSCCPWWSWASSGACFTRRPRCASSRISCPRSAVRQRVPSRLRDPPLARPARAPPPRPLNDSSSPRPRRTDPP